MADQNKLNLGMLKTPLFLLLLLFIQSFSIFAEDEDTNSRIILSAKERAWLAAHPNINLGAPTSFPPFIIKNKNSSYTGMMIDYFELINQQLNDIIKLEIEDSWTNVINKAKSRKTDGLALAALDKNRDKYFNATNVLFPSYSYIFARANENIKFKTINDLKGLRIGFKKSSVIADVFFKNNKDVVPVEYLDNESMTKGLLAKDVDVLVAWVSYEDWRRKVLLGAVENVMLITDHPVEIVTYIRKDWPELVTILNKVVGKIGQDKVDKLMDKWFVKKFETKEKIIINLTIEERNWLKQHPKILYGYDPLWAPIEYQGKKGNPQGISPSYMKRVAEILGIDIEPVNDLSWNMAVEKMAQRQLDLLPATSKTDERLKVMNFTQPYLSLPIAIFSDSNMTYVGSIDDLYGYKVAVPNNYAIHEWLKRDYPILELVPVIDNVEGIRLISIGEVDAFIGNLVTTSYSISKTGQLNIRVVGQTPYSNNLSVAVRKDWPELVSIIQKALNAIPESEKQAIYNDWISIQYQHDFNYTLMWKILAVFTIVILTIIFWNRKLCLEINRRKIAESELVKEKNNAESASQAKSMFLSSISHDLRTPLTSILGYSELIEDKSPDKDIINYTGNIANAGNHILDLINQLLELSKIESGALKLSIEKYEINELLQNSITTIRPVAHRQGIKVENLIPPEIKAYVNIDKIRFKQVVLNLLSNAIKYNRQNGKVIINYKIVDDNYLRILIEDTGMGLTEEQQQHLFKAYDRAGAENTEIEGTGLGLVISKDLIEKMNGSIGVESEHGKGTCFWMQFPIAQ